MSFTLLSIDLDCEKNKDENPVYRIWLDGCLIVERSYWPDVDSHYIQEQLSFIDDDQEHCLQLEQVSSSGSVKIKSIKTHDGDTLESLDDSVCAVKIDNNTVSFKTPIR